MRFILPHNKFLKALGCSAFAAMLLGLASHSYGQVYTSYSTTFNTDDPNYAFTNGNSLSGQDNWTDTDANLPDAVENTGYATGGGNDLQALFGGQFLSFGAQYAPSNPTDYLYHGFNPVITTGSYSLNVDFAIQGSTNSYPNSNSFGFNFQTMTPAVVAPVTGTIITPATFVNQFSVDFVPQSTTGATVYAVRYTIGGMQTTTSKGFNVGQLMHLSLSVTTGLNPTLSFVVSGVGNPITETNLTLTTTEANTINDIAATYNVGPATTPGTNYLLFDNFSAVPEPSTYAMLGLGLVGLATRFRRKARA